jgi:hypothetical protein
MPPDLQRRPVIDRAALAAGWLCLSVMAGCDSLSGLQRPAPVATPTRDAEAGVLLARHIDSLQRLTQGSAAEQAEIVSGLRVAYEQSHQPAAAFRYALALALPGHPARNPQQAQRLLREALAAPERLAPIERGLALLELQRVDVELRLAEENLRLTAELQRGRARDKSPAVTNVATKRLQAEIEENAKLRRALDEARAKLDAIANIEKNITDRKTPTEGRRP